MRTFTAVSGAIGSGLSVNPVLRVLMKLDVFILLIGIGLMIASDVFHVPVGGFVGALSYWLFILGLFLSLASGKAIALCIGFGVMSFVELHNLIRYSITDRHFYWGDLFAALVYGLLCFLLIRQFAKKNAGGIVGNDNGGVI